MKIIPMKDYLILALLANEKPKLQLDLKALLLKESLCDSGNEKNKKKKIN